MENVIWIARDEDGSLYLYWQKPERDTPEDEFGTFYIDTEKFRIDTLKIGDHLYPEVTWENSPMMLKPTEEEQP